MEKSSMVIFKMLKGQSISSVKSGTRRESHYGQNFYYSTEILFSH